MHMAIQEAKRSSENVGCGTVIVKGGRVIATAHNTQRLSCHAAAHAEINAIQKAGKKLNNKKLIGCTVYSTTEPCIMCLCALAYAKIEKLVFGLSMQETFPLKRIIDFSLNAFLNKTTHKFKIQPGFMKEDCKQLLPNKS